MNRTYGFYDEIISRFQGAGALQIFNLFNRTYAWMTYVGLIGMHGGISDKISSLEQLSKLMRPLQQPPDETLEIDLLWSDPDENVQYEQPNDRGAGVAFGEELVHDVCSLLGLKYIIRAHERVRGGFEYFAGRKMITVLGTTLHQLARRRSNIDDFA
ncbi:hypothetical protein niasHS_000690 [Heterodera schachtii]|uniref:protein-serine/threonine phosphatase n=1 Tax=Heterodera schachtii TaxID=97005 RepID=A0ABD2KBN1_HETSC